jgi:S-adenosylmethionine hydrolase
MPDEPKRIITLTTDFGHKDHYVASLKASILEIYSNVKIVDIAHEIPPYDILEAGFTLRCAYADFPTRTIHVCVVDPGVGTTRRPIVVTTENHYFIGPDNGVFSFIYDCEEVWHVHDITEEHYRRKTISATFEGRDIFGPAAGWLARGVEDRNFGAPVTDYQTLEIPKAKKAGEKTLQGIVIHVDIFGNLITTIHHDDIEKIREELGQPEAPYSVKVGSHQVDAVQKTYLGGSEGTVALIGSTAFLEIGLPRKGAAQALGAKRGDPVVVEF